MAKYTPRYAKKKSIRNFVPLLFGCALVLTVLLVLGSMSSGSSAKYVHETQAEGLYISEKFFFSSDLLFSYEKEDIALNATTQKFTFTLQNFEGTGEAKRLSEIPVYYQVTVTDKSGNAAANVTVNPRSGSLGINSDPISVTVGGLEAGNSYKITAVGYTTPGDSPAGYIETLTAVITVAPAETDFCKNTQNEPDYVMLTVWAKNENGTLTVKVPDGLIPDPSYINQANYNEGNDTYGGFSFTVTLNPFESAHYRFFKTAGSGNVSFTVTAQNGATVSETELQ